MHISLDPPADDLLVRIRGQQSVASAMHADPLDDLQHLIDLASVEDEVLEEDLTAVWPVQPGAHNLKQETFAYRRCGPVVDPQRRLAFLDAVQWGAVNCADSSVSTSVTSRMTISASTLWCATFRC